MPKPRGMVEYIIQETRQTGKKGMSLQLRLLAFFFLFLTVIILGTLLILFTSGVFSAGRNETKMWLENEINHIAGEVSTDFGKLSVEGVALSGKISGYLENRLMEYGVRPEELADNPEILTDLLSGAFDYLLSSLEKNRASGAFLILDATINPSLEDAEHSRAGLSLKSLEPNIVSLSPPAIRYMRGPMSIAQEHKDLYLPSQWSMEINTTPGGIFETVTGTSAGSKLPLSRLYYWSGRFSPKNSYEQGMYLCVPLTAKDGTVMGICGFEVSSMLFKLRYLPDNSIYSRVFAALAPMTDQGLNAFEALFAGNYTVTPSEMAGGLAVHNGNFTEFRAEDGAVYSGLYREITLYPKDSVYSENRWALAVMMPFEDLNLFISERNTKIVLLFTLLLGLSIAAAVLISRRYLSPLYAAFRMLKDKNGAEYEKTRIQEIDDLIEFLRMRDTVAENEEQTAGTPSAPTSKLYDEFMKNVGTLSPAERTVFELYLKGHTASEITNILYLSINTIKTHNKRIYTKLNVTSRKELMLFAEMMKERSDAEIGTSNNTR